MIRRVLTILLVASLVSGVFAQRGPGGGPDRPRNALLEKAMRVQSKLRFTGTRRLLVRLGPEAKENIEKVWQDGQRSRVEFERGSADEGQIIVIASGVRSHFFPEANEIQVRPVRMEEPLARLGEIVRGGGRGAQVRESGGGAVAGQRTVLLSFVDPNGNVAGKLWIDPDTAMVLKRELFDPSGRLVGSMEFLSVNSNPSFDENDFKIVRKGAKIVTVDELLRRQSVQAGVRPLRIPETQGGFLLESVKVIPLGDGRKALAQSYFGADGQRVSMYLTRGTMDLGRLQRLQGPHLASVTKRVGDFTIVLIGSMPATELQRLADQVR